MLDTMALREILAGIVVLGGAVAVIVRWASPALKLKARVDNHGDRIARMERHDGTRKEDIERNERANKLLCKAMVALLDNQITGNSVENLKLVKADLMEFLTE